MRLHTLIVSDLRLVRDSLEAAFTECGPYSPITTATARGGIEAARTGRPDIVVAQLDLVLGPRLIQAISVVAPESTVVAIGVDLRAARLWLDAGAVACAPLECTTCQLVEFVSQARRDHRRAGTTCRHQVELGRALTARERQVATLIMADLSNKEIARTLSISLATVKNHVHSILEKLAVDRRAHVGSAAARETWPRT